MYGGGYQVCIAFLEQLYFKIISFDMAGVRIIVRNNSYFGIVLCGYDGKLRRIGIFIIRLHIVLLSHEFGRKDQRRVTG